MGRRVFAQRLVCTSWTDFADECTCGDHVLHGGTRFDLSLFCVCVGLSVHACPQGSSLFVQCGGPRVMIPLGCDRVCLLRGRCIHEEEEPCACLRSVTRLRGHPGAGVRSVCFTSAGATGMMPTKSALHAKRCLPQTLSIGGSSCSAMLQMPWPGWPSGHARRQIICSHALVFPLSASCFVLFVAGRRRKGGDHFPDRKGGGGVCQLRGERQVVR